MYVLKNSGKYDDIIGLSRPVSKKRAKMSNYDRAAQFSPFAALTGYEGVIAETGRLTDAKIELSEDGKAMLDRKLRLIREHIGEHPHVVITVFRPDDRKLGGAYVKMEGHVAKLDLYRESIVLDDGREICIDNIFEIEINMLQEDML